jgi:hypothetical protein
MRRKMKIILEHVRSFSTRQAIPLCPLTLLVGENSSGKSTFLSVVSCVFDALRFPGNPAFNVPPYNLGTFDTIATFKGGKYGRDDSFSIGFSRDRPDSRPCEVTATYGSDYGNVVLRTFKVCSHIGELHLNVSEAALSGRVLLRGTNGQKNEEIEFDHKLGEAPLVGRHALSLDLRYVVYVMMRSRSKGGRKADADQKLLMSIVRSAEPPFSSCFSFAPIRSKPRRTYDEFSEEYSPEGDHIPTLLARLLREQPSSAEGHRVQQALNRFGEESGLFKSIDVKRLGKKVSDPFQVQVAVAGPSVNLTDVGYGVSQALPIVVQSVLKSTSKVMLLQQPEVHLHPRAQAALGSFFCDLVAKDSDRMFVVETHSDYLLDRVRQHVASGKLSPDAVQIVFFDKPQHETKVYPIAIDQHGNVKKTPKTYRRFFLTEELNLFTRTSE